MQGDALVILGSSRNDSNTLKAVQKLLPVRSYDLIDLHQKALSYYDYDNSRLEGDAFQSIAVRMLQYDTLVFATPVYWYTMSGQMKVFFDRLTELTAKHKPIGKALKGKRVYLVVSGGGPRLPDGFEIPFRLTADYFGMEFVQTYYQQGT